MIGNALQMGIDSDFYLFSRLNKFQFISKQILLNLTDYFRQAALGYTKDNYQALLEQIKTKVLDAEATPQLEDQYGRRYQVDLEIQGIRTEQIENVRTGWLIPPNSNQARLITAYIKRKL